MEKELSEMTLEELWRLFPILLREYNPDYVLWYQNQETILAGAFPDDIVRINHIGSTAVPGLLAKPTVDILMEISLESDTEKISARLKELGWILMNSQDEPIFKQIYNKGYTKKGFEEKVYHLHVRQLADWDELYFRDYLIAHKDIAATYAELKLQLLEKNQYNRDGYTEEKTEFVKKYSQIAKREWTGRYAVSVDFPKVITKSVP